MRQPLRWSLILAALGLMIGSMFAAAEQHRPGDLLLVDRGSIAPGSSALLRVKSKSGIPWNGSTRSFLAGGSAFVVGPDGDDLLVRAAVPLPDGGSSPSSATLEVRTTEAGETIIATTEVRIEEEPAPIIELLRPVTEQGAQHTTDQPVVEIDGVAHPVTALQVQLLNMTTGELVEAAVVQDEPNNRVQFSGSLSLVEGTNEILVVAFDQACLVCVPGEFFFPCVWVPQQDKCKAHILHIDHDVLVGAPLPVPRRLTGEQLEAIRTAPEQTSVELLLKAAELLLAVDRTAPEEPAERANPPVQRAPLLVFPGRPHPSLPEPRNILRIVLAISPPRDFGKTIYLRIVDPDDPSPDEIIDPNGRSGLESCRPGRGHRLRRTCRRRTSFNTSHGEPLRYASSQASWTAMCCTPFWGSREQCF